MIDHFREVWNELIGPGGAFELVTTEVNGVPARVYADAPADVRTVWRRAAEQHGDRTYLVYEDEQYTYADIAAQVRTLAHVLQHDHGVGRGDRVAIAMRNYPEWVVSYWAITVLGAASVGLNAWWTGSELEYGLTDSRPKVLIADDERAERITPHLDDLRAAAPMHLITVRTDRELPSDASRWDEVVTGAPAPASLPDDEIDPDDDLSIFYTSGTTGRPKGAQLTHRGSVTNLYNLAFMGTVTTTVVARTADGSPATDWTGPRSGESASPSVTMAATPLFHVTACNCVLHTSTVGGGTLVLTYRWDPARALELIERERVTSVAGVPTMSRELIAHPDWERRDTSSLNALGGGGAAMQPDLVQKIRDALPGGLPGTGYGLTETTGIVTTNPGPFCIAKPGSVGAIVPTLDAKLVDEAGNDLPAGPDTVGLLWVRGAIVIKGYLNRPDATAETIHDGWLDTGDVARIDEDGFVYIVDRAKDMVNRAGENIYCSEVESAIYELDDVAEAAVFGVPSEQFGEEVAAVVVAHDGTGVTAGDLRAFLDGRIAKFKIPTRLWVRAEPLPRNANGKFLKRELRDEYVAQPNERRPAGS